MQVEVTVSPRAAILAILLTFVLILFVGAILVLLLGDALGLVLSELLVVVVPLAYMLLKKINVRKYIGAEVNLKNVLLGLALGAALFLFDILISGVLVSIFGPSQAVEESNKLISDLSRSPTGLLSIVTALSLAGVCEEFTFRAFLQNAIDRKYSFIPALLISSLAFGLFHFDPQFVYIISAFFVGLLLGIIYHRWHSYVTSAIAHATVNLVILTIFVLIG